MAYNQETVMEPTTVRFTNLSQELQWKNYHDLFKEFGQITKLYIDPLGSFGSVQFSNSEDAYQAHKELDGKPPLRLVIEKPVRVVSSRLSSSSNNTNLNKNSSIMYRRGYNTYNNDDVDVLPSTTQYVDVYGRILDTLESEDGREIYVPISDLKKSGFEVFPRGSLPKPGEVDAFDEQLFKQHEMYLRTKSRKFMKANRLPFPEDRLNVTIEKLQGEYRNHNYQGVVDNSHSLQSPHFTPKSTTTHNNSPSRGRSEKRSFGGPERRVYPTYTNNTNSTNNRSNQAARDGSAAANNNFQSRRSYNDVKTSGGRDERKGYNNRYESGKTSVQAKESVNISKPPQREPLIKDTPQKVKVVHLETASVAWVQLSSNMNLIRDIYLQTMEESRKANVITPARDKICAALYCDVWLRVLITSTYPLTVQFIDFGSECAEDIKEIRELSLKLCNIPCQAIRIYMEFGSEIILELGMELTIIPIMQEDDGSYLVSVQKPKVSFPAVESVTKNTSTPSVNQTPLRRPSSTPPDNEIKPEVKSSPVKKIVQVTSTDSQAGKPHRGTVIEKEADSGYFDCTEVINEDTFVGVAMPESYVEEVCMLDDITNDCKPDPTFKPNLGDTVAVLKDDAYVRGVVINNLNKHYTCALVDYGITISVDNVSPLPDKYMNIPEFACVCTADHDTIQELSKSTEHLMAIKSPSRITVTLKDSGKICEIIARRWNPFETSSLAIKKNKLVEEEPAEEKPIEKEEKLYKTPLKFFQLKPSDVVIIISEVEGSLIVRTRECDITLKDIKQELNNYQGKPFSQQPEVDQLVVCPFSDGALYRGKVLSVKSPNAIIEYIDYGNSETIPIKELKTISEKLANLPSTCIKVSLKGFVKSKFSLEALSCLEKCAQKRDKFNIVPENDGQVYDLLFRDGNSLSEKLIALGKPSTPSTPKAPPADVKPPSVAVTLSSVTATPSSSTATPSSSTAAVTPAAPALSKTKLPLASSSILLTEMPRCKLSMGDNEVMCLFAGDVTEGTASFCIADPGKIEEKMMELTNRINAHVEKDHTPYCPNLFEVCLANFEGDWYRAAFIKAFENSYGMFYLDYGNTNAVTAEDIRKMPKELAEIECLSALCILQGVKQDDQPIKQPLLSKLVDSISENEFYKIHVISEENNCYVITIPLLFEEWKKEGLLS